MQIFDNYAMISKMTLFALVAISVSLSFAYAAEDVQIDTSTDVPTDIPINFDTSQGIIIIIGALGGITVAYLGWKKSPDGEKFDGSKFVRPIIVAILISIPLALTASVGIVELNVVTMFMVFMASLGTATLSKLVR